MARSLYLPDRDRLDALFAGVVVAPLAERPAAPRLRFPASPAAARPATAAAASAPPSGLLPLAEIDDREAAVALRAAASGETLEARLDAFLLWLASSTGAFASFIADEEGLSLANRHAPDSYMVATAALGIAERAIRQYVPRAVDAGTIFELDGNNVLQVLWVSTPAGRLAVGLVLGAPLPRAVADKARRMLQISVERKGTSR